jgi:hypothetical protein
MTNIALSAMLGASPPDGYESLYFDRKAGELRGGIRKYLGRRTPDKIPSSYMDDLDYQEPLPFEFLIYVAPDRIWRADMQRFRERFRSAPQTRDYFAFLKATDGLLHAQGPQHLAVALESLDHGMNLEENRRVDLATGLERRGFQVVIPAFGLCSYAALYCRDTDLIPEIARASAEITGVDFALYKDGRDVVVESSRGQARVRRRADPDGFSYRYVVASGDPLELRGVRDGFASDQDWFKQTAGHRYPDALANLYKALFSPRVKHTADVLLSIKDGYYYGWSPFGRFVRLAATHGNALQSSSNAFLMSTRRELPAFVRADDAKALLRG